jgi:ribose 5-phosphate isomerase B
MKIYIGADHAGYEMKNNLKEYLSELGHIIEDCGPHKFNPDDDYPDFVKAVVKMISSDENSLGIILGGSGEGEAMCANRNSKIQAVVFYGPREALGDIDIVGKQATDDYEIVRLAREHNNANIISLGARFITLEEAKKAVKIFLETPFTNNERHIRRLAKFND